jgi:hypothetical protein
MINSLGRRAARGEVVVTMQVSRGQLLDFLRRANLSDDQKRRVLRLDDPVDWRELERVLSEMGIGQEELINRMGGSP